MIVVSDQRRAARRRPPQQKRRSQGFTLLELVMVVTIGLVLGAMSIPAIVSTVNYFKFRSAVSSVTGAMQTARYQAIYQGCSSQVVFDAAAFTYQISGLTPNVAPALGCSAVYVPINTTLIPTPIGDKRVSLAASKTITFSPGGAVTPVPTTLTLTNNGRTATILVSNFGRVNVTITP
jgi:prepilin-type N-terminal cleavage/methylation domain-containing protein